MAKREVWSQTKNLLVVGNREVAQARFFVAQDDSKPLDAAFEMLVSLRFLGAQIDSDSSQHFPVTNVPVAVNITVTNPPTTVRSAASSAIGTASRETSSTERR
jgi:hypothetical protein